MSQRRSFSPSRIEELRRLDAGERMRPSRRASTRAFRAAMSSALAARTSGL
jgi:hypothetical protein